MTDSMPATDAPSSCDAEEPDAAARSSRPVAVASPAQEPGSAGFLSAIELTPRGPSRFSAVPQPVPWPKAYGGDLVAQALAAAMCTVRVDRTVHSTHSYFLRPVDPGRAVDYAVEVLRDGRSYSSREVRAYQDDVLVYLATVSFAVPTAAPDHAPAMPRDVPAPEDVPSSAEVMAGVEGAAARYWSTGRSFDMRHVAGALYTEVVGPGEPRQCVWIRSFAALPDDPDVHRLALAYACDYTILEPSLRVTGHAWSEPGLVTASLDHSLWFHREARLDDWVLYVQESASVQGGRGLGMGSFFSRDGVLIGTVAQEGLIRPRAAASRTAP